jgi:hypothetical protein
VQKVVVAASLSVQQVLEDSAALVGQHGWLWNASVLEDTLEVADWSVTFVSFGTNLDEDGAETSTSTVVPAV